MVKLDYHELSIYQRGVDPIILNSPREAWQQDLPMPNLVPPHKLSETFPPAGPQWAMWVTAETLQEKFDRTSVAVNNILNFKSHVVGITHDMACCYVDTSEESTIDSNLPVEHSPVPLWNSKWRDETFKICNDLMCSGWWTLYRFIDSKALRKP